MQTAKPPLYQLTHWCIIHVTVHQWQDLTRDLYCHCVMAKFPVQADPVSSSSGAQEAGPALKGVKTISANIV